MDGGMFALHDSVGFGEETALAKEALQELRSVLQLRGEALRAMLAVTMALGAAEQKLSRLVGEPSWDELGRR